MSAKRKPELIEELLERIEKLPLDQRRELLQKASRLEERPEPNQPVFVEPEPFPSVPKTELAKEMWALRQQIIAAGEPFLTSEELQAEIADRRGGVERQGY